MFGKWPSITPLMEVRRSPLQNALGFGSEICRVGRQHARLDLAALGVRRALAFPFAIEGDGRLRLHERWPAAFEDRGARWIDGLLARPVPSGDLPSPPACACLPSRRACVWASLVFVGPCGVLPAVAYDSRPRRRHRPPPARRPSNAMVFHLIGLGLSDEEVWAFSDCDAIAHT